jgi:transposase
MMGEREPVQEALFAYNVNLEKRVPADHLLRRIAAVLDLGFVREMVAGTYGSKGHVSEDPVVILKLMLLLFLDDVKSERELLRTVPVRLDYLWFLGLGLEDETPHHSVLSKARARWGEALFEQLFIRSVQQCVEAGLVEGSKLHVDSSLVDADAARSSVVKGSPQMIARLKAAYAVQSAKLQEQAASEDRTQDKDHDGGEGAGGGGGAKANDRLMSLSDPDAAVARKGRHDVSRLRYHHHRAVDDAQGVIVAVKTTPGDVNEATQLGELVRQAQDHLQGKVRTVVADRQYGTAANFVALAGQGIATHMADQSARQRQVRSEGIYGMERFIYDEGSNTFRCPAGAVLRAVGLASGESQVWQYRAPQQACAQCALRSQCTRSRSARTLLRHQQHELLQQARAQSHSRAAREDRRRRMYLMEGSFADGTQHHGFKRSRFRRLWRQRIQDWLIAALQNLRILLRPRRPSPVQSAFGVLCLLPKPKAAVAVFWRVWEALWLLPQLC